eukprot:2504389-Pleurochrysis_carterae.AAC.2
MLRRTIGSLEAYAVSGGDAADTAGSSSVQGASAMPSLFTRPFANFSTCACPFPPLAVSLASHQRAVAPDEFASSR